MATWADINYEYQLFRNGLGIPSAPVQGTLYPGAVIMAAPDEPPYPPAVILTKEYFMNFFQGFAIAVLLLLFILMDGCVRTLIVLALIGVGCYKYTGWKGEVAQFKTKEKTWLDGRMWPAQNQQRYIVQNFV